jgi:hypothetical protein
MYDNAFFTSLKPENLANGRMVDRFATELVLIDNKVVRVEHDMLKAKGRLGKLRDSGATSLLLACALWAAKGYVVFQSERQAQKHARLLLVKSPYENESDEPFSENIGAETIPHKVRLAKMIRYLLVRAYNQHIYLAAHCR